jgi:hypothetical protein
MDPMALDEGELPPESPLRGGGGGGGGGSFPRMPQGVYRIVALLELAVLLPWLLHLRM